MKSSVSVIGLGAMGSAMAQCLSTAYDVVGFDVSAERLEQAHSFLAPAASAADAVSRSSVVVVSVRDGAQLHAVVDSAFLALRPDTVVIVTSTVGSQAVLDIDTQLAARSVQVIDAPVSGGPVRAGQGDLLIMVGGSDQAIAAGQGVMDVIGSTVVRVGAVGDGQNFKTVNQLLCGIHTAAAAECLALAYHLGLDLDQVIDLLGKGAAASFMLADRGPRMAQRLRGEEPVVRSRLDVIAKDMGIVADLTRSFDVATPVAAAAEQLYRLGMAAGLAGEDDSITTMMLSSHDQPGGGR